jgi:hypothetical protein
MSAVLEVAVRGIGLLGPGLADWPAGRQALRTPAVWVSAPTVLAAPPRLAPTERRRAGNIVKLCFAVAEQACASSGVDPHDLATVFSSSSADTGNCHALCEALAQSERVVSPTRFTNSVHNAAAGYWHIATQSMAPSTSLAGFDGSFAAGLLEAAAQVVTGQRPVLLVAADLPYPQPLHGARPLPDALGIALLLQPRAAKGAGSAPVLRLAPVAADAAESACGHDGLDALRRSIPAARGLALLQALAADLPTPGAELRLAYLDGLQLAVEVVTA